MPDNVNLGEGLCVWFGTLRVWLPSFMAERDGTLGNVLLYLAQCSILTDQRINTHKGMNHLAVLLL